MNKLILVTLLSMSFISNSFSAERDYLIFDTDGEYAMGWGCKDKKVDFVNFEYDQEYQNQVLSNCEIENYLINLYEDRIVSTTKDEYYPTRSFGMNHRFRSIKKLGQGFNTTNFNGSASLYSVKDSWKWESSDEMFISLLPYNNDGEVRLSEVFACKNCASKGLDLALSKLDLTNQGRNMAWNLSFDSVDYDGNLVASFFGEVPRSVESMEIKAEFKLTFDYKTKSFDLKLNKVLESDITTSTDEN